MPTLGGVITTGAHPKALWPGIKDWWGRQYDEHGEEYSRLFDVETSDKKYEQDVEITAFGMLREKDETKGIDYDTEAQGAITTYAHVAYAGGYIVSHEELMDDQYEVVSKRRSAMLAFSGRQTEETVGASVFNFAFSTSYPIGDGAAMISASHPTLSGNQSNLLSTSADISETAIEDLCVQIMQVTDNRGNKIALIPQSLVIPPTQWFDANRILGSVLQNDTANNAINVIKATGMFPGGVVTNHYFTSATAWYIKTNAKFGLRWFWREKPSFDTDNEFDTSNAKAKQYERFSCGCSDWRAIWGTAGV